MGYKVKWSDEDMCYIALSVKYPSVKTHGDTMSEAIEEMKIVMGEVKDQIFKSPNKEYMEPEGSPISKS